ncbi:INO80 complex, subunit Ies [Parasponia andersonii]|uniref:INO80 complex, subunit Ies n=1 Tax=Parasponia andersonii TaxID=3476 RepID=A0A2P5BHG3_PARAD|nr:INO80 complex, subunit Ies [Parasponia andersonii]
MEGFGGLGVSDVSSSVRKKRSNASRRPRNDSPLPLDYREVSSLSDVSKGSSDENNGSGSVTRKKEMNLNLCSSRASFSNNAESESAKNVIKNEDGGLADSDEASNNGSFRGSNEQRHSGMASKRSSKGVLAPANWTTTSSVGHFEAVSYDLDNENKVKKVKLKVRGVTRTIHANSISDGASAVGSSTTKSSHVSDAPRPRPRQKMTQDSEGNRSFTSDKGSALQGRPWKDSRNVFNAGKASSVGPDEDIYEKEMEKYKPIRKSKRVSRRHFIDEALDDGEENNLEIQYLEKLRTSTGASAEYTDDEERESRKQRRISKVLKRSSDRQYDVDMGDYGSSRLRKETKKSRSGRVSDDTDYIEEEESISDDEPNSKRRKPRKEFVDLVVDNKKEMTMTTRQRALQTGKDVTSSLDVTLIEFPNGLPPAPPRKQKEKLSEVEQQLKKAEAAQRRRIQVEKAARESEAEAIRKILGQDSSRKKREDKIKKRKEDIAQERAANATILASDSVRWVIGPSGTVVTFPNEMGLPTIFNSKPCSYPPPREKCAGPSCTNPYKYRDSESKLPLCSLQCYKAIHEKMSPLTAC